EKIGLDGRIRTGDPLPQSKWPSVRSTAKRPDSCLCAFPSRNDVGEFGVPGVKCTPRLSDVGVLDVVSTGDGVSSVIQSSSDDFLAESRCSKARADCPTKIFPRVSATMNVGKGALIIGPHCQPREHAWL